MVQSVVMLHDDTVSKWTGVGPLCCLLSLPTQIQQALFLSHLSMSYTMTKAYMAVCTSS